jgi:hypothetical protein
VEANSITSKVSASIDGGPLFGHKLSPNEPFLAFLSGYSQKFWEYKGARPFFVTCLPSSSRFRHHTNYIPISGHHSFSLDSLSLFFNLLLTATVPSSCHPSRLYLPSTLLSIRIITKPFYQIFHIHLGPVPIFLGLVLRHLFSFRSVKLFFFFVFCHSLYVFLALRKPRVQS